MCMCTSLCLYCLHCQVCGIKYKYVKVWYKTKWGYKAAKWVKTPTYQCFNKKCPSGWKTYWSKY